MQFVYDGRIDKDILCKAVKFMVDGEPVLHSSFHATPIAPYWREEKYSVDDIVSVEECDDARERSYEFLTGTLTYKSNVQLKIAIFVEGDTSYFNMRINHMCMDGSDARAFLMMLVANYNCLLRGEDDKLQTKTGDRSFKQIYTKFTGDDLKTALGLYKNIAKCKDKVTFPWTPRSKQDKNIIVRRDFDADRFAAMRAASKKLGVTVNDAIMAMTFSAMYDMCAVTDNDSMTVSCAIDLRRHIQNGGADGGFTNHTAWLACRLLSRGDDLKGTLDNVIESMKTFKDDKFIGLYSLPLLNLGYTIFPHPLAEFAIKLGYDNPRLAVSNIGVLDDTRLTFDGTRLTDGFISGAVKFKPYFLMSVTTLFGRMTLSTTTHGTDKDREILNRYFDLIEKYFDEFCALAQ